MILNENMEQDRRCGGRPDATGRAVRGLDVVRGFALLGVLLMNLAGVAPEATRPASLRSKPFRTPASGRWSAVQSVVVATGLKEVATSPAQQRALQEAESAVREHGSYADVVVTRCRGTWARFPAFILRGYPGGSPQTLLLVLRGSWIWVPAGAELKRTL